MVYNFFPPHLNLSGSIFRSRVETKRTEKVAPDVAVRMSDSRLFLT